MMLLLLTLLLLLLNVLQDLVRISILWWLRAQVLEAERTCFHSPVAYQLCDLEQIA